VTIKIENNALNEMGIFCGIPDTPDACVRAYMFPLNLRVSRWALAGCLLETRIWNHVRQRQTFGIFENRERGAFRWIFYRTWNLFQFLERFLLLIYIRIEGKLISITRSATTSKFFAFLDVFWFGKLPQIIFIYTHLAIQRLVNSIRCN